ncbi:MAG: hypothetical protein HN757_11460, partial [Calditrichaeota bacterium]|nr:hypothetical protein [Calditrichota bacterium]
MTKYDLEKSISPQKGIAASVPLFLIVICVIFTSSLQAQPVNRWIRFFDGQNDRDEFFDIFATAEGGYAVAGYSYLDRQHNGFWIVLADNDGGELWRRTYTDERFPRAGTWCYSLIQADDGGFLLGGRARDANQRYNFSLLRVSADGERLWWRIYEEPNNSQCRAVIELKSGEFIGVGRGGEEGEAYAVMVNGDGDVLWENTYPGELFYALRETQGGLLFAGWTAISGSSERWLLKTDFDGEVLWSRTYNAGKLLSLVSCPEGGFAAGGHNFPGEDVNWSLLRVNDEGEQLWNRFYDIGESD